MTSVTICNYLILYKLPIVFNTTTFSILKLIMQLGLVAVSMCIDVASQHAFRFQHVFRFHLKKSLVRDFRFFKFLMEKQNRNTIQRMTFSPRYFVYSLSNFLYLTILNKVVCV